MKTLKVIAVIVALSAAQLSLASTGASCAFKNNAGRKANTVASKKVVEAAPVKTLHSTGKGVQ